MDFYWNNKVLLRKFIIGFLFFFLAIFTLSSQDVRIYQIAEAGNIIIMGENSSSYDYHVNLSIQAPGYSVNKNFTNKLYAKSNSTTELITLIPNGQTLGKLKINYHCNKIKSRQSDLNLVQKNNFKGITVFSLYACGRCDSVLQTMYSYGIPFTERNISFSETDKDLMWAKIREANFYSTNIQMPVFVIDGKTYFNINDLNSFILNLKY